MKKRAISAVSAVIMLITLLTGCSNVPLSKSDTTKEAVTSADRTALKLSASVIEWMGDLDANRGVLPFGETVIEISGHTENETWIGTISAPGFETYGGDNEKAVERLKNDLADGFNFEKDITAIVIFKRGKLAGCAYYEGAVDVNTLAGTFTINSFTSGYHPWNGKTDGIVGDVPGLKGEVVGTYPKLFMENNY